MKRIITLFAVLLFATSMFAQKVKVKVKNNVLLVNNVETAKFETKKNKSTLGLIKDYTISNLKGEVLITAVYTDLFPSDPNDNSMFHMEFTFPTVDKIAYFKVSTLGATRSLGNLIGKNGLIKDGAIDEKALAALIAKKGKTPPIVVSYEMADRPRTFIVELREVGTLEQAKTKFCTYKDLGTIKGLDVYEFYAMDGTLALIVRFAKGNNADFYIVETLRDNETHRVSIPVKEQVKFLAAIDRNYIALKRIGKWLVDNRYL